MIQENRRGLLFLACLIALVTSSVVEVHAQSDSTAGPTQDSARRFYFFIDAGAGFSRDIASIGPATASSGATYTNGGLIGLLRVRGSRSNFITVGLETGYQHLSSVSQQSAVSPGFQNTSIVGTLNAIPIMGDIAIQDYHLQAHAGAGFYRLISSVALYNTTVTSGEWDMAFMLGLSGEIPLWQGYKLIPELRFTRINDIARSFLALMLRVEFPKWTPL